jgi:hypothetical protein
MEDIKFSLHVMTLIFLILRRIRRDVIVCVHRSPCKLLVFFCQILTKLEFPRHIFKKAPRILNLMKIRPVGSELFHADGRTVRHDAAKSGISKFRESSCRTAVSTKICRYSSNYTRETATVMMKSVHIFCYWLVLLHLPACLPCAALVTLSGDVVIMCSMGVMCFQNGTSVIQQTFYVCICLTCVYTACNVINSTFLI